jgi:hypothetical protein
MTDTTPSLTAAKLMLTGAYSREEAEALAAKLDAGTPAPGAQPAPLTTPVPASGTPVAPPTPPADFVERMQAGGPPATAYTEAELRAMKAKDFAKMNEAEFAAVQRTLKTIGQGGGR